MAAKDWWRTRIERTDPMHPSPTCNQAVAGLGAASARPLRAHPRSLSSTSVSAVSRMRRRVRVGPSIERHAATAQLSRPKPGTAGRHRLRTAPPPSGRPTLSWIPEAVCVCDVSPLGHSLTPVFLQIRRPGCSVGTRGPRDTRVILRTSRQPSSSAAKRSAASRPMPGCTCWSTILLRTGAESRTRSRASGPRAAGGRGPRPRCPSAPAATTSARGQRLRSGPRCPRPRG
jgi:hypothetical protein